MLTRSRVRQDPLWDAPHSGGPVPHSDGAVGVAVGVALWRRFADDLGVAAGSITPWLLVLPLLCVGVAIVATLHPARRALQTSVSTLLRAE